MTSYTVYYSNTGKRWKPLTQVVAAAVAFKIGKQASALLVHGHREQLRRRRPAEPGVRAEVRGLQ
ncbi:MAG: hypothetical protein H6528_02780 [Actinobacteria bacterium]|nr:hypothetical protein [Actinomycetota bacterium]